MDKREEQTNETTTYGNRRSTRDVRNSSLSGDQLCGCFGGVMSAPLSDLDASTVRELFRYNKESGELYWIKGLRAGKRAGTIAMQGRRGYERPYRRVFINYKGYQEHRVVWLHYYGEWPENYIDHINGIGTDNRIENLRDVTVLENSKNQRLPRNNKSGKIGVSFYKKDQAWGAEIYTNNKRIFLGLFKNFDDAVDARVRAEIDHGFHINHGVII